MSLSPHEAEVLARLEEEVRFEDPTLAAALSRPPSPPPSPLLPPFPVRHLLLLLAVLVSLTALGAAFAEQLGTAGLGALTGLAVVPWLVTTARSVERRSGTAGGADRGPSRTGRTEPGATGSAGSLAVRRGVPFAIAAALMVLVLLPPPPAWPAIGVVVLTMALVALIPWSVVRVVERFERSGGSSRPGAAD